MGWVRQKIDDHQKTAASLAPLWNSLRDSIGTAIEEYKSCVSAPGVDHMDCRARGAMCIRVQKPGRFIEIFLSKPDQKVKAALGIIDLISGYTETPGETEICGYRLNVERLGLEFCMKDQTVFPDDVAKLALDGFLFEPFPENLRPAL